MNNNILDSVASLAPSPMDVPPSGAWRTLEWAGRGILLGIEKGYSALAPHLASTSTKITALFQRSLPLLRVGAFYLRIAVSFLGIVMTSAAVTMTFVRLRQENYSLAWKVACLAFLVLASCYVGTSMLILLSPAAPQNVNLALQAIAYGVGIGVGLSIRN